MTYNTLSANTLEDQLPLSSKQALGDSSGSLKERTEEPLGSLNKVYRAHFAWPTLNACVNVRACTWVVGKPAHLHRNLDSTRGWPRLGVPTLITAGK